MFDIPKVSTLTATTGPRLKNVEGKADGNGAQPSI